MQDRLRQAEQAPGEIALVQQVRREFGGKYFFEGVRPDRNGKMEKQTIEVDEQVEKAMHGAEFGLLTELAAEGVVYERER